MNLDELKSGLNELEIQFKEAKNNLYIKYALANNPYKIGDIISDHNTTIRISHKPKIRVDIYGIPSCVYKGVQLNKDGSPSKRQKETIIFQTNIKP